MATESSRQHAQQQTELSTAQTNVNFARAPPELLSYSQSHHAEFLKHYKTLLKQHANNPTVAKSSSKIAHTSNIQLNAVQLIDRRGINSSTGSASQSATGNAANPSSAASASNANNAANEPADEKC